jgi:hypothetical protein
VLIEIDNILLEMVFWKRFFGKGNIFGVGVVILACG